MSLIITDILPENPSTDHIYRLTPVTDDPSFYNERTDRNIGWISREEQELLRNKTVGISGCGGMGGLIASILLRVGVGRIKIADMEEFDVSNINRQFGAGKKTIGVSKAFATARALRDITDDTTIEIYPRGINEEDIDQFLEGCDVVLDEIEYWAVGARILLHQRARAKNIAVLNCNTVGFGTRLFFFPPEAIAVEECMGLPYPEAKALEEKMIDGTATPAERQKAMQSVARTFIPDIPVYCAINEPCGHPAVLLKRLSEEGKAPIIGCNPPLASGFVSDHTVLYLLKDSGVVRNTLKLPLMPHYLYFDAAHMKAEVRELQTAKFGAASKESSSIELADFV